MRRKIQVEGGDGPSPKVLLLFSRRTRASGHDLAQYINKGSGPLLWTHPGCNTSRRAVKIGLVWTWQPIVPDEDACGFRPDRTMTATDESRRSAKRYKRSNDPPFFWDASRRHQRSPSDEGGGAISRRRPQTDIHSPPPLLLQKRVETQKSVHKCVSRMPCPHNLREACIFSAEGVAT